MQQTTTSPFPAPVPAGLPRRLVTDRAYLKHDRNGQQPASYQAGTAYAAKRNASPAPETVLYQDTIIPREESGERLYDAPA